MKTLRSVNFSTLQLLIFLLFFSRKLFQPVQARRVCNYGFHQEKQPSRIGPLQQARFLAATDETLDPAEKFTRFEELSRFRLFTATVKKMDRIIHLDSDSFRLLCDTGASSSATNSKDDFLPGTFTPTKGVVIKGITSVLEAKGYGTVAWNITDNDGNLIEIQLEKVLLLEELPTRILSPQQLAAQLGGSTDGFFAGAHNGVLSYGGYKTTIEYNKTTNLKILYTTPGIEKCRISLAEHKTESNLSNVQRQLLYIHSKMNHISMHFLQSLARKGLLPTEIANCPVPLCSHCLAAKQARKHNEKGTIKEDDLRPGDCISVDQFSSPIPGTIHSFQGKPLSKKIKTCTIFTDHASDKVYISYQESASAAETVQAKEAFESMCSQHGVQVKRYHADNHIFNSRLFKEHIVVSNQTITFSGSHAHHQNGVAERKIRHVSNLTRASIFQAMLSWPAEITLDLWPYAVQCAVDVQNSIPKTSMVSANEVFANTKCNFNFRQLHPFGCPVFVLDPAIADGKKIPRWNPRSRPGAYLGKSKSHAGNISLVLNTRTRHVSPKYHLVYDDNFTTVNKSTNNTIPTNWETLFKEEQEIYHDFNEPLNPPGSSKKSNTSLFDSDKESEQLPELIPRDEPQQVRTPKTSNKSYRGRTPVSQPEKEKEPEPAPYVTRYGRTVIKRKLQAAVLRILNCQHGSSFLTEDTMSNKLNDLTSFNLFKSNLLHLQRTTDSISDKSTPQLPNVFHPCFMQAEGEKR